MVRKTPIYDLSSIRAAARDEDALILWDRAEQDRLNLGYSREDVAACIRELLPDDFQETKIYDDSSNKMFDVYITRNQHGAHIDHLYIKLKQTPRGKVLIVSFHPEGRFY